VPHNPVQVVLNAQDFADAPREGPAGGETKDFFAFRDAEFVAHRGTLQRQVAGIRRTLPPNETSYVKVTLHRSALAKSHRPFGVLLNPHRVRVVGTLGLGELVVAVTPDALGAIEQDIALAEPDTRLKVNRVGKTVPSPPPRRREVGVIERFDPYGPEDRRRFSVAEAIDALRDPRRGGAYYVDLFETPLPESAETAVMAVEEHEEALVVAGGPAPRQTRTATALEAIEEARETRKRRLFESFEQGLRELGPGLAAEPLDDTNYVTSVVLVRLTRSAAPASVRIRQTRPVAAVEPVVEPGEGLDGRGRRGAPLELDLNVDRHARLLEFLGNHPLVKRISLAPVMQPSSPQAAARVRPQQAQVPPKTQEGAYPIVGVIDGGIGGPLAPWVVGRWGFLAPVDQDLEHGTFIAGLLVSGASLNGPDVCPERDGCNLVDVDVFPNDAAFETYYPHGEQDFLDELTSAIAGCKRDYRVRVFNFSFNDDALISAVYRSALAQHLDAIAVAADVIIVISGGNLDAIERDEWSPEPIDALRQLAAPRGDETLQCPAESIRNITVASVNPPGPTGSVPDAPARYSRRGLTAGLGVKPEFAHYGGSGTACPTLGSGLFSITPTGNVVEACGTSYAAPLVAKTVAALDAHIEGDVPRETLLALMAHRARVSPPLTNALFKGLARQLVGFGQPPSATEILQTGDYEITLVFHSRLMPGKSLNFEFPWPQSLSDETGNCRGLATMTLAYTPPIDAKYGAESVRVNLDARLQQDIGDGHWEGAAHETFLEPTSPNARPFEKHLIEHGLKWSPLKTYKTKRMTGRGKSSTWRLVVEYITRSLTAFPAAGVPFTVILTIEDFKHEHPIFSEVRRELIAHGARLSAIRTAARIQARA
jgi:Subtilase family